MQKIAILNYNAGNLASVANALLRLNARAEIISRAEDLKRFDKLILPGVGAFGDAMAHLKQHNFDGAICEFAARGAILGICLGMQLLFEKSYEFGESRGLGLLKGEVVRFDSRLDSSESLDSKRESRESALDSRDSDSKDSRESLKARDSRESARDSRLKIPHMGWNRVFFTRESALLKGIPNGAFLYFVHSFFARPADESDILAKCDYGKRFCAIAARENIFGIQPHPEKSADFGLKILENFIKF